MILHAERKAIGISFEQGITPSGKRTFFPFHFCKPLRGEIWGTNWAPNPLQQRLHRARRSWTLKVRFVHSFSGFYSTFNKSYQTGDASLVKKQTLLGLGCSSPPQKALTGDSAKEHKIGKGSIWSISLFPLLPFWVFHFDTGSFFSFSSSPQEKTMHPFLC